MAATAAASGVPTGLPTVFTLSSQSLVFNFSQRDNIRAAAAGLEAAKLALKESRSQVEEDVLLTYLSLDSDQQRQAAMVQEYGFATHLVAIVQDRVTAGLDTRTELLQARRTAKQLELSQLHIESEIAALSDHLARAIGLPGNYIAAVPSSIPQLPSIALISANGMDTDSFGVQSALAGAQSKQEIAFGAARYRLRRKSAWGLNYSRIDTGQNDYTQYYPNFSGKSANAESLYFAIQIPIYDRRHEDQAREAAAEASRARFEAEDQRNQFLEGRAKLRHSASELAIQTDLAEIDRDLAQEQLNTVLAQLSAESANLDRPQLTPKDEQNARVAERARAIDLMSAQFQMKQAQVNLLRQTGQLEAWLRIAAAAPQRVIGLPPLP